MTCERSHLLSKRAATFLRIPAFGTVFHVPRNTVGHFGCIKEGQSIAGRCVVDDALAFGFGSGRTQFWLCFVATAAGFSR